MIKMFKWYPPKPRCDRCGNDIALEYYYDTDNRCLCGACWTLEVYEKTGEWKPK